MVIVKDNSVKTKHLEIGVDEELLKKYASSSYIEHILMKQKTGGVGSSTSKYDELLIASQAN